MQLALFIPGFQRAQWHKKAGVGAGRDSPNGTVIMTLEQPKKKPELLISLLVCVCARGVRGSGLTFISSTLAAA